MSSQVNQGRSALPDFANGVQLNLDELLCYQHHAHRWKNINKSRYSQRLGGHASRQKGRGMDFSEVRRYQSGDDVRTIDWRVTARTGKPHTKLFTEDREQPTMLYIDLSHSMQFGSKLLFKSVQAAHLASLYAWMSVKQQNRIGAMIDTGKRCLFLPPTSRKKSTLHFLQQLVTVNNQAFSGHNFGQDHAHSKTKPSNKKDPGNHSSISTRLRAIEAQLPKGGDIILISDFQSMNDADSQYFKQLSHKHNLHFCHIFDPLEHGNTQFTGQIYASNGKRTQCLDFSNRRTKQEIKSVYEREFQALEEVIFSFGGKLTSFSSGEPLLTQIPIQV